MSTSFKVGDRVLTDCGIRQDVACTVITVVDDWVRLRPDDRTLPVLARRHEDCVLLTNPQSVVN